MTSLRLTVFSVLALLAIPLLAQNEATDDAEEKTAATGKKADEKKSDDRKDAKPESGLKVAEDEVDPVESWKKLNGRRGEIFDKLQDLRKKFDASKERAEKEKIRDEFQDLIREFDVKILPEMREIAATVFEKDPTQLDAGELVLSDSFKENQFEKAAAVADALLKADRRTKTVLSLGGVSLFATHEFEKAVSILSDAQKSNRLEPRYATFLEAAEKYVGFWKAEQEIRTKEAALTGEKALPQVAFETTKGKIVFELFEDQAPNTVANFISLVEAKKYDRIKFHRVIAAFMAQGGDPNTLDQDPGNDGRGGPGYTIKCECYRDDARRHFRGSLSMAHSGPDTGGSQFFITHLPTDWLNAQTDPEKRGHTVFGRVIEGMDVASSLKQGDSIKTAAVVRKRPHEYKPETTPDDE